MSLCYSTSSGSVELARSMRTHLRVASSDRSSTTTPNSPVLLGGSQGVPRACRVVNEFFSTVVEQELMPIPTSAPSTASRCCLLTGSPVSRRVTQTDQGIRRGLSELSHVLCVFSFRERVPQPPGSSSNTGDAQARLTRGRLLFGYFILAAQDKVTSCRAAPGDPEFPPARE